jgi:hypothetical protein
VLALTSSITRNPLFKICWPWRVGRETLGNRLPLLHFLQAILPMHLFTVKTPSVRLQAYFIFTNKNNILRHNKTLCYTPRSWAIYFCRKSLLNRAVWLKRRMTHCNRTRYHKTIECVMQCLANVRTAWVPLRDCICSMYTTDNCQTSKHPRLLETWQENKTF